MENACIGLLDGREGPPTPGENSAAAELETADPCSRISRVDTRESGSAVLSPKVWAAGRLACKREAVFMHGKTADGRVAAGLMLVTRFSDCLDARLDWQRSPVALFHEPHSVLCTRS